MLVLRRTMMRLLRVRSLLVTTSILMLMYVFKLVGDLQPGPGTCSNLVTKETVYSRVSIPEHVKPCTKKLEYFKPNSTNKIDWHNYTQISYEAQREGVGEQGKPVNASAGEMTKQMLYLNGFNTHLSDKIALNRSLPDIRHPRCKNMRYIESLPSVSVIIPFYNEHWSALLRAVHSVLTRSPPRLILEVLLVDDGSLQDTLKQKLDDYVRVNMSKVRVIHVPKRVGPLGSRRLGAEHARADVLLFCGSHAEVNVNWLPPLLEPIALDYKVAVFPFIDTIAQDTFEYRAQDEGARGAFDWELFYKRLPVLPRDQQNMPEPFESPVMAGDVFAISRAFFWELGGYDPGMRMWGGEVYELSFKIWMCGGRILNAPCSRVGDIFTESLVDPAAGDFISKNLRRVVGVWMDEYSEHVYSRRPHLLAVDPGVLHQQRALRRALRCKSFKWFMRQIAFDVPPKYPPTLPKHFAEGQIRSVQDPALCLDAHFGMPGEQLQLRPCLTNKPPTNDTWHAEQRFEFSWYKDIRSKMRHVICWDVPESAATSPILLLACHHAGGNQQWQYHEESNQIVHVSESCLDYNVTAAVPYMMPCDADKHTQRWTVDIVNQDMMAKWGETPLPVTGPIEYVEPVV